MRKRPGSRDSLEGRGMGTAYFVQRVESGRPSIVAG